MDKFLNFKYKPKSFLFGKFFFIKQSINLFYKAPLVVIPYFFFLKRSSTISLMLNFYILNPLTVFRYNQNWYIRKKYPINKPVSNINLLALL